MKYRENHLAVLKVLAEELPSRATFTVEELARGLVREMKPKIKEADSDRATRNALRKPVSEAHVEAAERGVYRLTSSGAKFMALVAKEGYEAAPGGTPKKRKKVFAPKKKTRGNAKAEVVVKATAKIAPKKAVKGTRKGAVVEAAKPARKPRAVKAEVVTPNGIAPQAQDKGDTLGLAL